MNQIGKWTFDERPIFKINSTYKSILAKSGAKFYFILNVNSNLEHLKIQLRGCGIFERKLFKNVADVCEVEEFLVGTC